MNKPKQNYKGIPEKDMCQTPPYALNPLARYIEGFSNIWECASGEGLLADTLRAQTGANIITSDILQGQDFFTEDALKGVRGEVLICTNPPFSQKYKWLERCYLLGYPFALLMPADTLFAATANRLFKKYGIEIIIMNPRIDFKMPSKGWSGNGAQMATAWFTWRLSIGRMITFADVSVGKKAWKKQIQETSY